MSDHETPQSQEEPRAPQAPVSMEAPAGSPVPDLPVSSLREAIPHLRRPFSPEAVRFKVQTVFKEAKGCIVVAYIDARLVIERLNAVVPDRWWASYSPVEGMPNMLWCHLQVCEDTRSDVGEGQGFTDGLKRKAAVSDSLKRAAVHFGIGVSVYALPQITLYANQPHVEATKGSLKLTEKGHVKLREGYGKWLAEHGERLFGEVLGHGDVEGQVIDEDAEAPEFVPELPPALDDPRAQMLVAQAQSLYEKIDHRELPPQRFNAWLNGARHSHAELERLIAHLNERIIGAAA